MTGQNIAFLTLVFFTVLMLLFRHPATNVEVLAAALLVVSALKKD